MRFYSDRKWLRWCSAVVAAGGISLGIFDSGLAEEPDEKRFKVIVVSDDEDDAEHIVQVEKEHMEKVHAGPKLWLGIMLKEIEGDLAKYLGDVEGILVDSVYEGSPAEKAGIQDGDILLEANDQETGAPAQLLDILHAIEEGDAVSVTVLRRGKEVELKVTPAARPEMEALNVATDAYPAISLELAELGEESPSVKEILRKLKLAKEGQDVNVFRLGGPAFTWRGKNASGKMNLKIVQEIDGDKTEIQVTRNEDSPATITITKGDEVTEYQEDEMEEMPDAIAEIVAKHLSGQVGSRMEFQVIPNMEEIEIEIDGKEIAGKAREMAEKYRERVLEQAKEARKVTGRIRAQVEKNVGGKNAEVQELRTLVETLRQEVQELQKQLKKDDVDAE